VVWACLCACDARTISMVRGSDLVRDAVKSCGCLVVERNRVLKGLPNARGRYSIYCQKCADGSDHKAKKSC
jgi:hypothetical protein